MLTLLQGYIIGNTQVMTVHAEYKTSNQLPPPVPRSESNFSLSSQVLSLKCSICDNWMGFHENKIRKMKMINYDKC